jgi:amino acid transporter
MGRGAHGGPVEGEGNLGMMGMVGVGFFWVSGGLYGNEIMVASAPPGVLILLLVLVAVVYAIPSALVSAELSTAIPEDGGAIEWAKRAFGFSFAMHNAWWTYTSFIFDVSLYPVLAADYLNSGGGMLDCPTKGEYNNLICDTCSIPEDEQETLFDPTRSLVAMAFTLLITLIKLKGLELIVKLSTLMSVLSLLPCVIWVFISLPHLDFGKIFRMTENDAPPIDHCAGPDHSSTLAFDLGYDGALESGSASGHGHGHGGGGGAGDDAPPTIDISTLWSFIMWLNIGWIGLGALAGQVRDPATIYPRATAVLFGVSLLVNIVPVMVAVSLHPEDPGCDPTMKLFKPGESFLRVHWVAVPEAMRARRVNRLLRCARGLPGRRLLAAYRCAAGRSRPCARDGCGYNLPV